MFSNSLAFSLIWSHSVWFLKRIRNGTFLREKQQHYHVWMIPLLVVFLVLMRICCISLFCNWKVLSKLCRIFRISVKYFLCCSLIYWRLIYIFFFFFVSFLMNLSSMLKRVCSPNFVSLRRPSQHSEVGKFNLSNLVNVTKEVFAWRSTKMFGFSRKIFKSW